MLRQPLGETDQNDPDKATEMLDKYIAELDC